MLKFKLTSEDHGKLSDAEKTFYKKDGDGYALQVEGAVDKSKLDEFRSSNVELLKNQEKYKDIDLDKYGKMVEQERKLKDKELIDAGDIDTLIAQKVAVITADFEGKISNLQGDLDKSTQSHNSTLSKYEIGNVATKAFADSSINPDFHDVLRGQINSKFSLSNGSVVAMDGENIVAGKDGNLTISEFVSGLPESYKTPSSGGDGKGGHNHTETVTKTAAQKIADGLGSAAD